MIFLITGGAGCGKSSYAEDICMSFNEPRFYIATMRPFGDGSMEKIKKHRKMREGKGFITIERYTDLRELKLMRKGTVLLECVTNLTANEMYDEHGNISDPYNAVIDGITSLSMQADNLVIITNEVGCDAQNFDESTKSYIRTLGKINIELAELADHVYEMVCGIPLVLKGELII